MKKIKILIPLLIVCLVLSPFFGSTASAKTETFDKYFLELNLDDDVICLTKDTPTHDSAWATAGITDASKEKKSFSEMNIIADLYDPTTKRLVRVINKTSNESRNVFNMKTATKEQIQQFYDAMLSANDETTTSTIEDYPQGELPFFRYVVKINGDNPQQEIIYGTIANGSLLYFDTYAPDSETIDESFQQTLTTATHFTKLYTLEEFKKIRHEAIIRIALFFAAAILLIVVLTINSKRKKKKKAAQNQTRLSALHRYYEEQKAFKASGAKEKLLYENHTTYTKPLLHRFLIYTYYLKRLPIWITAATLYVILLVLIFINNGLGFRMLIFVGVAFALMYYLNFKMEKQCTALWIPYDKSKSKVADLHFYETYFTISGVQYFAEYPYLQITSIGETSEYIYLYFGDERGVYIDRGCFVGDGSEFVPFLKEFMKSRLG